MLNPPDRSAVRISRCEASAALDTVPTGKVSNQGTERRPIFGLGAAPKGHSMAPLLEGVVEQ